MYISRGRTMGEYLFSVFKALFFTFVVLLGLVFFLDHGKISQKPELARTSAILSSFGDREAFFNLYDDGKSSVHFRVNDSSSYKEEDAIRNIMAKKKAWQNMYPEKKIVTEKIITGIDKYDHPITVGLLIKYENVK
jgi:hypothetical protein